MEKINGRTPEEIKRIHRWLDYSCGYSDCDECQYRDICHNGTEDYISRDTLALIERLEAERDAALAKVPKWISAKERLPERYTPVLIFVKSMPDNPNSSYICLVGVYDGDYWMKDSGHYYDDIDGEAVCWMPLPEPPEVS